MVSSREILPTHSSTSKHRRQPLLRSKFNRGYGRFVPLSPAVQGHKDRLNITPLELQFRFVDTPLKL